MTSWVDLAGLVAPHAPTLGKMLGGLAPFPGGALLGEWAGSKLAEQFGVPPTPAAVEKAIRSEPAPLVANALVNAEAEASAKWQAMAEIAKAEAADRTGQSQAINETIRAELANGVSWWHWRHLIGYATLLWSVCLLPPLAYHMWRADAVALQSVTAALTASTIIFGIMAALNGYIARDNTNLKETAITGERKPNIVAAAVQKMAGRQ